MTITEFLKKYGNHKFFNNSSFSLKDIEIHTEGTDSFFRGMATSGLATVYFNYKLSEEEPLTQGHLYTHTNPDESSLNNAALTRLNHAIGGLLLSKEKAIEKAIEKAAKKAKKRVKE